MEIIKITPKAVLFVLVLGCLTSQAQNPPSAGGGLREMYDSTLKNVETRGPELAKRLYAYMKEPCALQPQDEACDYARIYPFYTQLTQKIATGLGVTWEGPEKWDDFILRSAYWNISPFGGLTKEQEEALKVDMVRWLISRRSLAHALKSTTPLLLKLSGNRATRSTKVIVPLVRAYFAGLSVASRQYHILDQMHCEPAQSVCQTHVSDGIATLKDALKNKMQPALELRAQIAENGSPLLSDLHAALAKVVELDRIFQKIESLKPGSLKPFAAGQAPDREMTEILKSYIEHLDQQIAMPKNLSNESRVKIWAYAIALNDLIATFDAVSKMESNGQVKPADHLLRPIHDVFESLKQFLIDEGIESEKIFRDTPKAGS